MSNSYFSKEIQIGNLRFGADNPVRVQSMTNTNTMDTVKTVNQCISLAEKGCELIRVTARSIDEATNLYEISKQLKSAGFNVPLVADIHFSPGVAEVAARFVEKIRINPGNYIGKTSSAVQKIFSESEYKTELEEISNRLSPLVTICKENGTAIRIGVNHGSLAARIVDRYGDTPEGMAVSALEYATIFEDLGFDKLVISLKSSDVIQMILGCRILMQKMIANGIIYPLHLGVTEAGGGEEGIIRSTAGIASLLQEGIGDTIRVSLTGDPLEEIPVAKKLVKMFPKSEFREKKVMQNFQVKVRDIPDIFISNGIKTPVVVAEQWWCRGKHLHIATPDLVFIKDKEGETDCIVKGNEENKEIDVNLIRVLNLDDKTESTNHDRRELNTKPIIIKKNYSDLDYDDLIVHATTEMSLWFIDAQADGLWITANNEEPCIMADLAFKILQSIGRRRTSAEFIACPTCGRSIYDVSGVLKTVKERFSHLHHLKIAVMGCIVNGPGEMAGSDYGCVGTGPGKVRIYKGSIALPGDVDESEAVSALEKIIRKSGDWVD